MSSPGRNRTLKTCDNNQGFLQMISGRCDLATESKDAFGKVFKDHGDCSQLGEGPVTLAWHVDSPACSHHRARGPPGSPPLHSPPTGAGSTLSWGSRGTTSTLMSERPQCRQSPLEGSPRRRPGSRQKPWCGQQGAPTCRLTWDPPSSQLGRPSSLSGYPQRSSWSEGSTHTHPRPLQSPGS